MKKITPKEKFESTFKAIANVTPSILISYKALIKMKLYIENCNDEIGWFFTVDELPQSKGKGKSYLIDDALLFEQKTHATTTEINEELLSKFAEELLQYPNGMDIWNSMRGWGHSHVNMGITPSGQDDSQMDFFKKCGQPYFIRIIGNKKGEFKVDLYDYSLGFAYFDVPWVELTPIEIQQKEARINTIIAEANKKIDKIKSEIEEAYKLAELEENLIISEEVKVKVSKFYTTYDYSKSIHNTSIESKFNSPLFEGYHETISDITSKKNQKEKEKNQKEPNVRIVTLRDLYDVFTIEEISKFARMPNIISLKQNMPARVKDFSFTEKEFSAIFRLSKVITIGD